MKKAYILNYDKNDNAATLYSHCKDIFDTYVVHNGASDAGLEHIADIGKMIKCPSGYSYAIEAVNKHFLSSDSSHVLYICSDVVLYEESKIKAIYEAMPQVNPHTGGNIGMVSPCIMGRSWGHMQPHTNKHRQDLRVVSFVEGICFMAAREIVEICGDITPNNTKGWGIDIWFGYLTRKLGMESVVMDEVSVIHPEGSSYNTEEAREEMIAFIKSKESLFIDYCKSICVI